MGDDHVDQFLGDIHVGDLDEALLDGAEPFLARVGLGGSAGGLGFQEKIGADTAQAARIDEARIVLEDFLAENAGSSWAGTAESSLKQLNESARQK